MELEVEKGILNAGNQLHSSETKARAIRATIKK